MIRRLLILLLCLAAAASAAAQADPARPPLPTLTPAQRARADALAARALAAFEALPATERIGAATSTLANDFVALGRCSLAEPLVRAHPIAALGLALNVQPAVLDSDRACADRLITLFAEALVPGETERDAWSLYTAGMLWRRIGQHEKAEQAIERAERRLMEEEARDPERAWSCHGGYCLSSLWSVRLWTLGLLRGTDRHHDQLRWLGTLALSIWYEREAHRSGTPYIGQRVFEELLPQAVDAGDDRLAQLLAEPTPYGYPAAYAGQRMRRLYEQGRIAEALELWPTAGGAFNATITPSALRANLPLFHRWREQLRTRLGRNSRELLPLLAAAWIERGEPERAREALATARAQHSAVRGFEWEPQHVQRLRALEAMLEGGGDPVGWLGRQNFPPRGPSLEHDHAFRELAALLAAANRQVETRRALAAIRDSRLRQSMLIELPCRAAYGGDAAAAFAVGLARGHLRPRNRSRDEVSNFGDAVYQTFLCLIRAHRGEAAIAYVQAVEDSDRRLGLLVEMPLDSGIPDEPALRRRFANLALPLVEARNLWADRRVAYMAADFERAGDYAQVDHVLARTRGEIRMEVYDRLLRVYAPGSYF